MCCTASNSFLEQARIAAAMMEPMKMRVEMIIENMLLTGSRLGLDCGEVKSPANYIYSQSNQFIQYVKN